MIVCKTTYVDGLYFEILSDEGKNNNYLVQFLDKKNENNIIYEVEMTKGMWAKLDKKYLMDIDIVINKKTENNLRQVRVINSKNIFEKRRVFICFDSSSLGDTLAWIPYCEEFRKKYDCEVFVSTFMNELFEKAYPGLKFVGRGVEVNNIHGMFQLGWFYDKLKEPVNPCTIPLQQAACNILNLEYKEIIPNLSFKPKSHDTKPFEKYVCISTKSTAQLKEWYYWQELIDWLVGNGYKVIEVSKDDTDYINLTDIEDKSLQTVMNYIHHADFFIGLSSGLSWMAWAMRKKVFMIANFSRPDHEFQTDCIRITNDFVCNSCWNNPAFRFNRGDFFWCPEHEDTPKSFECHKSISAEIVINKIKQNGYCL